MAENTDSISVDWDQFSCAICLDLLKDPLQVLCGHNFCMECILDYWDQDNRKSVYRCPECKETFTQWPVLGKNTRLAAMVEKLKEKELEIAPPAPSYAEPGDVECDDCTGRKCKAVRSCLVCLTSFCKTHFKIHNNLNPGSNHKIINATSNIEEMFCFDHDKVVEVFCRTDNKCICYLCTMYDHAGHDIVPAEEERKKHRHELEAALTQSQQTIQEREKRLQELRQAVESVMRSAQAAVDDSEGFFTELMYSIERRHSEVTEMIRAQERAALSPTEGLLEQLEQEIAKLRRRDAELRQLSDTENHIDFILSFKSLGAPPEIEDLPGITVNPHLSLGDLKKSVSELKERLELFCKQLDKISGRVIQVQMTLPYEPKTREEFLQYYCPLTLDPNTTCPNLCLCEGNRKVTWSDKEKSYPDHPDRFTGWYQVLCEESVSGRCYWEVEWSGRGVGIALAYKGIGRKGWGFECGFGWNDHSWRLYCSPSCYSFRHSNIEADIPIYSRVGVFLDQSEGTLSFYSISGTMTLLHRVYTRFTRPLYPGILVDPHSNVKICQLEY